MSNTLRQDNMCGLSFWHPKWIQSFSNTRYFMLVYGLLGTVQAMASMYFIITLTTLERRFKLSSQTTGIVLSGNEVSQIMFSLILSYFGGQRNRPRWIAWGMVFCALSSYIIALPHFIYGAGEILQFTEEYYMDFNNSSTLLINSTQHQDYPNLCSIKRPGVVQEIVAVLPLILIFLSQFVLGIGNTMYYSLGQTYLDDNTEKTNTPMMLATAIALRMVGPIIGFFLGYVSLNMFIDTTKTPLIDRDDPRWLGAWWFGWLILGTCMLLFSVLIGLFPKELPKKKKSPRFHSEVPKVLRLEILHDEFGIPISRSFASNMEMDNVAAGKADIPSLKNFPKALMRLLRNKLLVCNITASTFYLLGASGYMTFLSKYMEIQFQKNPQNATVVIGPISIFGMVLGLLASGIVLTKAKPSASKVLFYNVIVGIIYMAGQTCYIFLSCGNTSSMLQDGILNVSTSCNLECACDSIAYYPVCNTATDMTYFSPCHAGCRTWNPTNQTYTDCICIDDYSAKTTDKFNPITTPSAFTTNYYKSLHDTPNSEIDNLETNFIRNQSDSQKSDLSPGPCFKDCYDFWVYTILSMVINWFGSSARVGNMLVNYRAVSVKDKSFAQGLTLMVFSLFASIPGPIIFGRIIDSTCLVWVNVDGDDGNCQLYDQTKFRYYVNSIAVVLTAIGVFFDVLVWYYGKDLDLYGEKEQIHQEEQKRKNAVISPLLSKTISINENANNV